MFLFRKEITDIPDAELIDRYRRTGEDDYFAELFKRHTHLVLGICMNHLRNDEDSKDAVMEVFEHVRSSLKGYEVGNFKNWLYTVTRNHCLMKLRRVRKMPFISVSPEEAENLISNMENQDSLHLIDEEDAEVSSKALHAAIEQLSQQQKTCIKLFYIEGRSYQEIAKLTKSSLSQVKSNIQNGRRNLKNILRGKE